MRLMYRNSPFAAFLVSSADAVNFPATSPISSSGFSPTPFPSLLDLNCSSDNNVKLHYKFEILTSNVLSSQMCVEFNKVNSWDLLLLLDLDPDIDLELCDDLELDGELDLLRDRLR